jgi:hypothetical protein
VAVTLDPYGDDVLNQATQLLRQHTDTGWTAISANILNSAFAALRPSEPVRGRHDFGDFFVASTVVVSELRHAIDTVPHAAATRIACTTDDEHHLTDVTIQIIVAYGSHLLTVADHIHQVAVDTLRAILGDLAPTGSAVHTHVHIGDITDDPREVL